MNILITGGLGYIGSHLSLALDKMGYKVKIIDKELENKKSLEKKILKFSSNITIHYCNIEHSEELDNFFDDNNIDFIFHFAGLKSVPESHKFPEKYFETNVTGTEKLLNAFSKKNKNLKRFIFSSSASVYGKPRYLPLDENHSLQPLSPYGESKVLAEEILKKTFKHKDSWSILCLRYFNPVGDKLNHFYKEKKPAYLKNLFENISDIIEGKEEKLKIYGQDYKTPDKTCIRDFIHIDDLISGHISAMTYMLKQDSPLWDVFNLGTGSGYSVLETIRTFENIYSISIQYEYFGRRIGDIAISYSNPSKAKDILKWKSSYGLEEMVKSIKG